MRAECSLQSAHSRTPPLTATADASAAPAGRRSLPSPLSRPSRPRGRRATACRATCLPPSPPSCLLSSRPPTPRCATRAASSGSQPPSSCSESCSSAASRSRTGRRYPHGLTRCTGLRLRLRLPPVPPPGMRARAAGRARVLRTSTATPAALAGAGVSSPAARLEAGVGTPGVLTQGAGGIVAKGWGRGHLAGRRPGGMGATVSGRARMGRAGAARRSC